MRWICGSSLFSIFQNIVRNFFKKQGMLDFFYLANPIFFFILLYSSFIPPVLDFCHFVFSIYVLFIFIIIGYSDNIFTEQAQLELDKSVGFGCGWYAAQRSCPLYQIPSFLFLVCILFIVTGYFSYSFFFFSLCFHFLRFFHLLVPIERENCG